MRILLYVSSENNTPELKSLVKALEQKYLIIVDNYSEDFFGLEYVALMRHYDYIFFDIPQKEIKEYYGVLKALKDKGNINPIFINSNFNVDTVLTYTSEASFYTADNLIEFIKNYSEENFSHVIEYKGILIELSTDEVNRTIFVTNKETKETTELKLKNLDYLLLVYFLRHHNDKINIDRLTEAVANDPEYIRKPRIESAIYSIKKAFRIELGVLTPPIESFKKVGYKLAY